MPALSYGPAYRTHLVGSDGYRYRADVERVGSVLADPVTLKAYGLSLSWAVEGGGIGAGVALSPLMPCTATLVLQDPGRGAVATIQNTADLEVRLRVLRDVDGDGSFSGVVFVGVLMAEASTFYPHEPSPGGSAITLRFSDGFGLLRGKDRAFDTSSGGFGSTFLRAIKDIVFPILGAAYEGGAWNFSEGGLAGLYSSVNWYPRLPSGVTQIAATEDPLDAVAFRLRSLVNADGVAVSGYEALTAILSRFNARMFQADGRLHIVQRELLARTPAVVPTWGYVPDGDGVEEATGKFNRDLTRAVRPQDATGWGYLGAPGPQQENAVAVGKVESTYAYEPAKINLIANGDFEEYGDAYGVATTGSDSSAYPRYWNLNRYGSGPSSVQRLLISNGGPFVLIPGGDTVWAVVAQSRLTGNTPYSTTYDRWTKVVGSADAYYTFRFTQILQSGVGDVADIGGVTLQLVTAGGLPTYVLKRGVAVVRAGQAAGKNVRLYVEDVLDGVSGAVNGSVVVPEGTAVVLYRVNDPVGSVEPGVVGTLTLARDLKVGDGAVYGDLEVTNPTYDDPTLDEGDAHGAFPTDELRFYYWQPYSIGVTPDRVRVEVGTPSGWTFPFTGQAGVAGTASSGAVVSGYVRVTAEGPLISSGITGTTFNAFTGIELIAERGGGADGDVTYSSALPAGTPGQTVTLPVVGSAHPFGDGPGPGALTRLFAGELQEDGTVFDTLRGNGQSTAWQHGTWVGATPASEFTIDALTARTALQMLGGLPERWSAGVQPSAGADLALSPLYAATVTQASALMAAATAGATSIRLPYPPELGEYVIIDGCTAIAETRTVTGVVPATAPDVGHVVSFTGGLSHDHAAEAFVIYCLRVWPDTFGFDAPSGTYEVGGTRLRFRSIIGITNGTGKTGDGFAGDPGKGDPDETETDFYLLTQGLDALTTQADEPLTTR